jgi:pyruvate carboxylase
LGTFEFLANPKTEEFYFLEINPRLQVEHTITETLCDVDLVLIQLLLAQGATLEEVGLSTVPLDPENPPPKYVCQFRVTAEDVSKEWSISIGKLSNIALPCGNGVRVDSALVPGQIIGSSFDSLLAKIIVCAPTWQRLVEKSNRCLAETSIDGVQTNLAILRGIAQHPEFGSVECDTRWLERKQQELLRLGKPPRLANIDSVNGVSMNQTTSNPSSFGAPVLRRGDAWAVELESVGDGPSKLGLQHVAIDRILENNFPSTLRAEISFSSQAGKKQRFKMSMNSTTASATAVTSRHRRGNPSNPRHVIIPFPGKLVEVMVDVGDIIQTEDVVCVVQQMKMEIEIRAKFGGRVAWVTDAEDGEDVNEGVLAAELDLLDEKGTAKL